MFFLTKRTLLSCAVLMGSLYPGTARAGVVLSENFDELTQGLSVTSVGAFSAINGTNVDVVGVNFYGYCNGPESGNCIDMDGSGNNSQGQLQSNTVFGPGYYLLSFDLIGTQRGNNASVTVLLGNYDETFTLTSSDFTGGVVTNQLVLVTTPSNLSFISNTPGLAGLLLDNVTLATTVAPTVPEPSSAMLIGSALMAAAGLLIVRRRLA